MRRAGSMPARRKLTIIQSLMVAGFLAAAFAFLTSSDTRAQETTLSSEEVFNLISPAIPFIETPLGTGSGILIDDRHVLTDAHVVWPYAAVSVRFPGDPAIVDVPVVGWDLMVDLAVLELPTPSTVTPVVMGSTDGLPIGSQLFAIGYPGTVEGPPSPIISVGLVSRLRSWTAFGINFVESDAAASSGMSGGALVTADGKVVGITQFTINSNEFVLGASTLDALGRVNRLLSGEDVDEIGARYPEVAATALTTYSGTYEHFYDAPAYVVEPGTVGNWNVTLDSTANTAAVFESPTGELVVFASDFMPNTTDGFTLELTSGRPGYLFTGVLDPTAGAPYTLTSSLPLIPLEDPDDGRVISESGIVFGSVDHPTDLDTFVIQLQAGDTITVTVDSLRIDPFIAVDQASNNTALELAFDDDSGGGFFGVNARLSYTAPATGEYLLITGDVVGFGDVGGYVLNVAINDPAAALYGTFSAALPTSGVGLSVWQGGSIAEISTAAAEFGCDAVSFWVTPGGSLIGYLFGAPEFVNKESLALFPGGFVDSGTVLIMLCE